MDIVSLVKNNWQVSLIVLLIVVFLLLQYLNISLNDITNLLTNNLYIVLGVAIVGYLAYRYRMEILVFVFPPIPPRPPFRNALNPPR